MTSRSIDFERIRALDARFAFLEEPEVSLAADAAGATPGLRVGVKSNIRVRGQAWTAGIAARRARIADTDAEVVARLRRSGAGILSRLNMDEAALGATSRNPGFRVTLNPAAEGKSPGGSSGGSAAAVVSGACDVALGTDTLGSVRIPAAYCGVYGLKTGRGVLPMDGVFPLAPSLDTLGLLGRTTAEICTALDALDVPEGSDIERIAVAAQSGFPHTAPCILAALDRAATALGATECDAGLDFTRIRKDAFLLTEIEGAQSLADERVSEGLRRLLDYGEALSKDTRSRIADRLATAASQVRALAGSDTVLLLPTVSEPAFPIEGAPPPGQADFTAPANVAGLPALAIPIPSDGLPISLQLVGPEGSERALLALAERLSEAF